MLQAVIDHTASSSEWLELETFSQCRRKYQQRFVLGAPPEFVAVERFLDDTLHELLAWFLTNAPAGPPSETALVDRFHRTWAERLAPPVRPVRAGEHVDAYAHRGEMMLRRFHHDWAGSGLRPEAAARSFRLRLVGRFELLIRVDLVARDRDGGLHAIEHVTGPRARGEADPDAPLKLRAWGLAVLLNWRAEHVRLTRHLLSDGRKLNESLSRDEAVTVVSSLAERIEQLERCAEYPARPSLRCAWCGYRSACTDSGFPAGFVPLADSDVGRCPKCASSLGLRNGRLGVFVTCARYPECRYSRDF